MYRYKNTDMYKVLKQDRTQRSHIYIEFSFHSRTEFQDILKYHTSMTYKLKEHSRLYAAPMFLTGLKYILYNI